jgi:hypothetical protein
VAVAVLVASLAACGSESAAGRSPPTSTAPAAMPSSDPTAGGAVPTDPTGAVRIQLRIGDDVATATLEDSAPARDFAAMLPTTNGQTIPQPGLVRLGTVATGLEVIAAAGNDFELTIEPLD